MRKLHFSVDLKSFDLEAFAALKRVRDEERKIIEDAITRFRASDRFKAARDLAKHGDYGSKIEPVVLLQGATFEVSMLVETTSDSDPTQAAIPYLDVSEKTLNALLHSKLLTDAEKRMLIHRATRGAITAEPPFTS